MPLLAFLIFLTVSSNVELVDEVYQVPANDWRYVDLGMRPRSVVVRATFQVESGPAVRMMLMTRRDMERMSHGEPYVALRDTKAEPVGGLQQRIPMRGDYVVAIENRGAAQESKVHLRITLDFGDAQQLSPERRLAVIAISFAVFFGLVSFSAIKLWRAANP